MRAETTLKICEYNVENLFLSMEYYAGEDLEEVSEDAWRAFSLAQLRANQKPLAKIRGVARAILDIAADVYLLAEVGGLESLENFNRHFLGDRYVAHFIEGNSKRNIDLGFLVRRDLPFRVEAHSNKDYPVEVHSHHGTYLSRFSRDVGELRLYDSQADSESTPILILLLTHLKSMISTQIDLRGKDVRTAEATALAALYAERRAAFPTVPIVVGGDFNSGLESQELMLLQRTDLTDFHDVLGTPANERVSLVHFAYSGHSIFQVLDYLLVSPQLVDRIVPSGSGTYRYRGLYDVPEPLPETMHERFKMPSDHYPVVLTIRI